VTSAGARPGRLRGVGTAEELIDRARSGDAAAVEKLLAAVRDRVYRLSLRMLANTGDAEDATQEILIKVLTRLDSFRGDAAYTTWVHRIAVNHLLDQKRSCVEAGAFSFEDFAEDLQTGLATARLAAPGDELLAHEVRLGCTLALLTCLDREHRVAYILGEIFQVTADEGAYICDVAPATYRKRLSRARSRVRGFLADNCGHISPERATCRCARRIGVAVRLGRVDPDRPELVTHATEQAVAEIEDLSDVAGLMRAHPAYAAPPSVAERIAGLVRSGRYDVLSG